MYSYNNWIQKSPKKKKITAFDSHYIPRDSFVLGTKTNYWLSNLIQKDTFKLGVSWGRKFWMFKCVKDIWVFRRRGGFSVKADLNFSLFLIQNYYIFSEGLEYSKRVKRTTFIILLLFFCHYWSLRVKISVCFHCSLVILGEKKNTLCATEDEKFGGQEGE